MFLEIENELKNKIKNITNTDYEYRGDFLSTNSIIPMLKDLVYEIQRLEEKIETREEEISNNYKQITPNEMYGIDDRDFVEVL